MSYIYIYTVELEKREYHSWGNLLEQLTRSDVILKVNQSIFPFCPLGATQQCNDITNTLDKEENKYVVSLESRYQDFCPDKSQRTCNHAVRCVSNKLNQCVLVWLTPNSRGTEYRYQKNMMDVKYSGIAEQVCETVAKYNPRVATHFTF